MAAKRTTKSVAKNVEADAKIENIAAAQDEVEKTAEEAPQAEEKEVAAVVKKTPGRKPGVKKTVKKADQKVSLHVQFAGKSYSEEELIKIAQDVWKYDLKQKVRELASIELYVKPEENLVYYVMNEAFTGSFVI